jgi:hypothetical protein
MLDHGGLRRATLRGCEKLTKRHMVAAMTYNPEKSSSKDVKAMQVVAEARDARRDWCFWNSPSG